MGMTIDWDEAAVGLKSDVDEHGGFLTMQKDTLRERFDIGRLTEGISQDLVNTLEEHGMIILPHPYNVGGPSYRVYDVESEIGKIARAVGYPQDVPETALVDAVNLYERDRRKASAIRLCSVAVGVRRFATTRHWETTRRLGGVGRRSRALPTR